MLGAPRYISPIHNKKAPKRVLFLSIFCNYDHKMLQMVKSAFFSAEKPVPG